MKLPKMQREEPINPIRQSDKVMDIFMGKPWTDDQLYFMINRKQKPKK